MVTKIVKGMCQNCEHYIYKKKNLCWQHITQFKDEDGTIICDEHEDCHCEDATP